MMTPTLFGHYRNRVLGLLLMNHEMEYHVREIARITHTSAGSLHKELSHLTQMGILKSRRVGNQVHYRADMNCPVIEELTSIARKSFGLKEPISQALQPHDHDLTLAFIFGSVASGTLQNQSDVDVMLVGDISFKAAVEALHPIQAHIQREINPVVYSLIEWQKRIKDKDPFILNLLKQPKLWIKGEMYESQ